jgi:1,4-dihydroxy-2-naphthoyl-CoA hydrolase
MADDPRTPAREALVAPRVVGWDATLGLVLDQLSPEGVTGHLVIEERHRQLHGFVHGGVYATLVESLGSLGATLSAPEDKLVFGVENQTSFVKATREGVLFASAVPLTRGNTTQLWQTEVKDEAGRLLATGRLRLVLVTRRSE